jgi:hypothetical protein
MIVISRKRGRLANRVILFAHFIVFSEMEKIRVLNPVFDEYCQFFEGTSQRYIASYPPAAKSLFNQNILNFYVRIVYLLSIIMLRVLRTLRVNNRLIRIVSCKSEARINSLEWKTELKKSKITFVDGWLFRHYDGLYACKDLLMQFFRLTPEYANNVKAFIGKTRSDCDLLIGVHIRRGDYETFQGGKYYFAYSDYRNFMRQITKIIPTRKAKFLVCSDEPIDTDYFVEIGVPVTKGIGHPVEDLYCLAECDYLIGPPSTYTMWASFYGQVPLATVTDAKAKLRLRDFRIYKATSLNPVPSGSVRSVSSLRRAAVD